MAVSMASRVEILNLEELTLHEMFEQPDKTWLESYLKSSEALSVSSFRGALFDFEMLAWSDPKPK